MHKLISLKVKTDDAGARTTVELDGQMVPARSINVDFDISHRPLAQLELELPNAEIDGQVQLYLHPSTTALLKKAGWCPPISDDPGIGWMENKSRRMLALIILAAGGTITLSERDITGTNFDDLVVDTERHFDGTLTYRVHRKEGNENP